MMAVALGDEVEQLAAILVAKGTIRMDVAEKELLVIRAKQVVTFRISDFVDSALLMVGVEIL